MIPFFLLCYLSGLPSLVFLSGCLTGDPFLLYYFLGIALLAFPFGVPSRRSLSSRGAPNRTRSSSGRVICRFLYLPFLGYLWVSLLSSRPLVLGNPGGTLSFTSLGIILNLLSFRGSSAALPDNLEPQSFLPLCLCSPRTFA